jgi:hypothetical protein
MMACFQAMALYLEVLEKIPTMLCQFPGISCWNAVHASLQPRTAQENCRERKFASNKVATQDRPFLNREFPIKTLPGKLTARAAWSQKRSRL